MWKGLLLPLRRVLKVGTPDKLSVDYEEFISGKSTEYDWLVLDENSPLGLCYTSGTTGNPKERNMSTARSICTR